MGTPQTWRGQPGSRLGGGSALALRGSWASGGTGSPALSTQGPRGTWSCSGHPGARAPVGTRTKDYNSGQEGLRPWPLEAERLGKSPPQSTTPRHASPVHGLAKHGPKPRWPSPPSGPCLSTALDSLLHSVPGQLLQALPTGARRPTSIPLMLSPGPSAQESPHGVLSKSPATGSG